MQEIRENPPNPPNLRHQRSIARDAGLTPTQRRNLLWAFAFLGCKTGALVSWWGNDI